jgi:hypothetical protein
MTPDDFRQLREPITSFDDIEWIDDAMRTNAAQD